MQCVSVVPARYHLLEAGRKFEGLGVVLVFVTMPNFKFNNFLTNSLSSRLLAAVDLPFRKPKNK